MYTRRDADQSAALLAAKIRAREPFFFLRYGDGALECIYNTGSGRTCDGERYSQALGQDLLDAWVDVVTCSASGVYVGDWLSAAFDSETERTRYADLYAALIGEDTPEWLHFEALLLMRESATLVDFYRAVKEDPRRKLFMGPSGNADAAKMLGAEFLSTPMDHLHACAGYLSDELISSKFDVVLYGAGLAGNLPVVHCWKKFPERTYINLGSAMDPLFRGRTREQQISPERARELFKELL